MIPFKLIHVKFVMLLLTWFLVSCDRTVTPDPVVAVVYNMNIGQGKVNEGTDVDFFSVRVSTSGFYGLSIYNQGSCSYMTPIGSPSDTKDILILGKVPDQISWEFAADGVSCANLKQQGGGSDKLSLVDPAYYQNSQNITPVYIRVFVTAIEPNPIINTNYNSGGTAYTKYTFPITAGVIYDDLTTTEFICIIPKQDPVENLYFRLGFTNEKQGVMYQMWTDTNKPPVNGFPICGFADITYTSYRLM